MSNSGSGLFITATDTGVGKTFLGCLLVQALIHRGAIVAPRKPVESGCVAADTELRPGDGLAYFRANGGRELLSRICPYRFVTAASPERAAFRENVRLTLDMLTEACDAGRGTRIVEGAGGFYSPIAEHALNADLAMRLGLPVLLVVPDRLGCINHALLTTEAIERRGLDLFAVVLNTGPSDVDATLGNADALRSYLHAPVLELAPGQGEHVAGSIADLLLAR